MGSLSIWHWLLVLVVVLLLFGRGKIPDLMGDVAKGIKNFKSGMKDDNSDKDIDKNNTAKTIDARADETVSVDKKSAVKKMVKKNK